VTSALLANSCHLLGKLLARTVKQVDTRGPLVKPTVRTVLPVTGVMKERVCVIYVTSVTFIWTTIAEMRARKPLDARNALKTLYVVGSSVCP
jgi:hypothetical protein